jgi:hypothetical protein
MTMKYTIVVVSDHDLSLHDGKELINDKSYSTWKRAHHECTFTATWDNDRDAQMREVWFTLVTG